MPARGEPGRPASGVSRHDLDHAEAAWYFERLFAPDPSARQEPQTMRQYAAALRDRGQSEEARMLVAAALDRCRPLAANADRDERSDGGGSESNGTRGLNSPGSQLAEGRC